MSTSPLSIYVVRHGATAWSVEDRHTGRRELPLSDIDRVLHQLLGTPGPRLLFSHSKTLRVLAARWLERSVVSA